MEEILVHLPYFGPISHFAEIVKPVDIWFENEDNYQKQTYRNRTYIYGANGKLLLNIPIRHLNKPGVKEYQRYKDVSIDNESNWRLQHWKSLKSAYQTSPFFEYYEDDIAPLFQGKENFLMDFNYKCFHKVLECLQLSLPYNLTQEYIKEPLGIKDRRDLINAKKNIAVPEYTQVFQDKNGFIHNLSILDLLFNEGPNTLNYLREFTS